MEQFIKEMSILFGTLHQFHINVWLWLFSS